MKKIVSLLCIIALASCSNPINKLSVERLVQLSHKKIYVYKITPLKGGHIINVFDGKNKGWFFLLNKPDSIQEGKQISGIRIIYLK